MINVYETFIILKSFQDHKAFMFKFNRFCDGHLWYPMFNDIYYKTKGMKILNEIWDLNDDR